MAEQESHVAITDFDVKENTKRKVVFRKYPCIEWGVACAFLVTFCFCEFLVQLANEE